MAVVKGLELLRICAFKCAVGWAALFALLLLVWCGNSYASGAADQNTVLILGSTVTGGAGSVEAVQSQALGLSIEVASDQAWLAKTSDEFRSYRAIVIGDPTCSSSPASLTVAAQNRATWGPTIQGNIVVVGTDPGYHFMAGTAGAGTLTKSGINYAAAASSTGAYISLSCDYAGTPSGTPVPLLDVFGAFTVVGQTGCPNNSHIVAQHPALAGLTDASISNWYCSTHEAFVSWPARFKVLAISRDLRSGYTASDGSSGAPYILARGATGFYVAIDAGHGSIRQTNGTSAYQRPPSPTYRLIEDQITFSIAQAVQTALTNAGIRVLMIRDGDAAPFAPVGCRVPCLADTRARAMRADRERVDLFVSIHTNAGAPTAHGTEAYYTTITGFGTRSQAIAQQLFDELVNLGLRARTVQNDLRSNVLTTHRPAALTEVAFHTNSQLANDQARQTDTDEFKLSTAVFISQAAQAIARAIQEYHATHP